MRVSEHELLSFSARKEIIENDNSLVGILLSKAVENESLQHYLDMLKLQKNEWNDVYIFFARRDARKLSCLTGKFQEEAIEPL